jgi:pimeloyl-ACP methyl ester carboxylesterase
MRFREHRISAKDGLRLYCRDYGDPLARAVPVVCLAGLARNSKDFAPLAERLAPDRRVVALDYRGRGRSQYDPEKRHYRPEVYIDDVLQIMAALGLHHSVICGTSMGGLLTMGLAVARPSVIAGAILNDIGPDLDLDTTAPVLDLLLAAKPHETWQTAAEALRQALPTLNLETEEKWLRFARATYHPADDGLLHPDWDRRAIEAVPRDHRQLQDLWPYFRALTPFPTLAIRGELSEFLTGETLERMVDVKPDLRHIVVANRGHAPILDEPESVSAIDDFLTEIDRRNRR